MEAKAGGAAGEVNEKKFREISHDRHDGIVPWQSVRRTEGDKFTGRGFRRVQKDSSGAASWKEDKHEWKEGKHESWHGKSSWRGSSRFKGSTSLPFDSFKPKRPFYCEGFFCETSEKFLLKPLAYMEADVQDGKRSKHVCHVCWNYWAERNGLTFPKISESSPTRSSIQNYSMNSGNS